MNMNDIELVSICPETGAEVIMSTHWTMHEAMTALTKARHATELRFEGVTLAHKGGAEVAFTNFRPIS
jgi:hypothetical protein